jgi:hypothetical protein
MHSGGLAVTFNTIFFCNVMRRSAVQMYGRFGQTLSENLCKFLRYPVWSQILEEGNIPDCLFVTYIYVRCCFQDNEHRTAYCGVRFTTPTAARNVARREVKRLMVEELEVVWKEAAGT